MQQIREIRKKVNISVNDLAEMIGTEPGAVYHYESNRRTPDFNQCWKIVNALNQLGAHCSFDDVFPNPKHKNSLTTSKPLDGPYQKVTTNESDQHPRKNRELKDKPHGRHGRTAV